MTHGSIAKRPSPEAEDSRQSRGEEPCDEVTASLARGHTATAEQVSPAVSLPISPSTDENYKTESDGNKRSSQSGTGNGKPNCYECKHRGGLVGDAHSECKHPRISESDRLITGFALMAGTRSAAMKRLNISGDPHGIRNSWFFWPLNFDPVWLLTCDGFEKK